MNKWLFYIFSFTLIMFASAITSEMLDLDFDTILMIAILGQLLRHDIFPTNK